MLFYRSVNPAIAKCEAFVGQENELLPERLSRMGSPHANTLSLNDDTALVALSVTQEWQIWLEWEASPSVTMHHLIPQRMLPPSG